MHVKVVLAVNYIAVVQFLLLNTVTYNVAVGTCYRLPYHVSLTTVLWIAYCHELGNLLGLHLGCGTEHAQILD